MPGKVRTIRIGTRGSALARWQSEWVAAQLRLQDAALAVAIVEIKTTGDRDRSSPLAAIGGTGLFTKEIQRAVLEEVVDLAVHSLKDLPTRTPEGLLLGAITAREDPVDALVAPVHRTLEGLPQAARVGTSAPRRAAQLRYLRPDLVVESIRGNVETRLNYAREGRLDAVVLAWAGLKRLGLEGEVTERLCPPGYLPAVGQGALGIECRAGDEEVLKLLAGLDDPETRRCVTAERALLASLGGGCSLPMAAWARQSVEDAIRGELALDAAVFEHAGRSRLVAAVRGAQDQPVELGRQAARLLLEQGAGNLLGTAGETREAASS